MAGFRASFERTPLPRARRSFEGEIYVHIEYPGSASCRSRGGRGNLPVIRARSRAHGSQLLRKANKERMRLAIRDCKSLEVGRRFSTPVYAVASRPYRKTQIPDLLRHSEGLREVLTTRNSTAAGQFSTTINASPIGNNCATLAQLANGIFVAFPVPPGLPLSRR